MSKINSYAVQMSFSGSKPEKITTMVDALNHARSPIQPQSQVETDSFTSRLKLAIQGDQKEEAENIIKEHDAKPNVLLYCLALKKDYVNLANEMIKIDARLSLPSTRNFFLQMTKLEESLALHKAVEKGHIERVRLLIQTGLDPNTADEEGRTALHIIMSRLNCLNPEIDSKDRKIINLLIEAGADPDLKDLQGNTPLGYEEDFRKSYLGGKILPNQSFEDLHEKCLALQSLEKSCYFSYY